jgi:putative ATP-dependent endonuclease of OLD family
VILASVAALIEAIPTQKLVTTNSGELLSMLPLASLRRIVARAERTDVRRLRRDTLTEDELRRIGYHVRANRGSSLFARCWLLVEGETEFWLLPEFAELCGHDFALEGVRCMEFAQCGIAPLVKLADDLGIGWHLLADGDRSGRSYASAARSFLAGRPADRHVTMMAERDVEHLLWASGYSDVYRSAIPSAAPRRFDRRPRAENPTPTIERAIRARSKPGMALEVVEAARREGSPGVPATLRAAIERSVELARASIAER